MFWIKSVINQIKIEIQSNKHKIILTNAALYKWIKCTVRRFVNSLFHSYGNRITGGWDLPKRVFDIKHSHVWMSHQGSLSKGPLSSIVKSSTTNYTLEMWVGNGDIPKWIHISTIMHRTARPVVHGDAGGAMVPPDFGRSVTLSQPRGADYAHQILLAPPDFQTFRRPCLNLQLFRSEFGSASRSQV